MYMNTFKIEKRSGTYAELLETYGFANLLSNIFDRINILDVEIAIFDKGLYYEVTTDISISDKDFEKLSYFPLFKYIKQKANADVSQFPDFFDYPKQKEWKKERQELLLQIYNEYSGKEKKTYREKKLQEVARTFEQEKRIDSALDVYSQIVTPNNFPSFEKLYYNLFKNKELFQQAVKEIVHYYGNINDTIKEFDYIIRNIPFCKNVTATQLYNPSQGQGANKQKADGLNRKNFDSSWINECMKISGSLTDMICQPIKIGSSYDLKIFVPEYKQVNYRFKMALMPRFKKHLKGNTPIKIDILNILLLTQMIIEHFDFMGRRKKVKDVITGLHSVYQKDLGKNKAVVNIGFIQVPDFVEIASKEENQIWIDILQEQRQIIGNIKELGITTQGLLLYRNFISGSDINSFLKFSYWHSIYLSTQLSNNKYVRIFSIETLNKFYKCMDTKELKLTEIISNVGFNAVARAIRKSTVSLQYTPKECRKFDIRYGMAQNLQTKSKSKEDLAEFIGEFIALYNSDTARQTEKTGSSLRTNVKENELVEFYTLLDYFPSKLVGALLASYGFALKAKETTKPDETNENSGDEPFDE